MNTSDLRLRLSYIIIVYPQILTTSSICKKNSIYGLVQDGSNSIANALHLLQHCTKLSVYTTRHNS